MKQLIALLSLIMCAGSSFAGDVIDVNNDGKTGLPEAVYVLQVVSGIREQGWQCQDDDEINGIYRICNYFPLNLGNRWIYTTGDRTILNIKQTCSSGCAGIKYGTTTYEYEPIIQNGEAGLVLCGCEYERPSGNFIDYNFLGIFAKPEMKIGETIAQQITLQTGSSTVTTKLNGPESVTVPTGTYTALKLEITVNDFNQAHELKCSYIETLWLVKNVGPVKIHRTNPNPSNCSGCIFVCRPDNNLELVNTPAELLSAEIDGKSY